MSDGTVITIADATTKVCTNLDLDKLHYFCGLGSDGGLCGVGEKRRCIQTPQGQPS